MENKFKKWHLIFIVVLLLSYTGLKLWQLRWPNAEVTLAGQTLKVLVANNNYHYFKGLSDRKNLGEYSGMLFVYNQKFKPTMVMRDMLFPLDIVWFADGKIVDIAPNLQPEKAAEAQLTKYYPRVEADIVLELPAGWANKFGLKIGDKLGLPGKN
ncbi:MAG: hypothetical protein US42_C0011G0043 [Candidatus Magasanikbacteria bacterium GW2011_GWC2_37_14]|uniref:DUF192 domain-containing protein n=1 Tax=Candidatus Magasanikbacteria bacterium GW2011_GWC2_37_14 TaxID=1619046 RepID=A0A0G0GMB9_9BACT|nr:MAG: hypothetical protein US42_C0011G0043 [Candidatus Magasanikbacteria bacterium GW2011_GWC2_37_14]